MKIEDAPRLIWLRAVPAPPLGDVGAIDLEAHLAPPTDDAPCYVRIDEFQEAVRILDWALGVVRDNELKGALEPDEAADWERAEALTKSLSAEAP